MAFAMVVALCLAFYWSTEQVQHSQKQVADTYEVLVATGSILTKIADAETAQRGYILTDRQEFLQPYRASESSIGADLQRLRYLTRENPTQQAAIARLSKLIEDRLNRIRGGLEIRRTKGFEAARQSVLTNRGNELMEEIRASAHQIEAEAATSLDRRYDKGETNARRLLAFFSALAAGNFCLLILSYGLLKRDLARRREAFETQSKLVQDLETANQDLKDFAHVVSHDLKAPLRGISSLAIFLQADYGDRLGPEGRENLSLLEGRVKRLHDLIEGILHYSRMARLQEEKRLVDVKRLLKETVELLAPPPDIRIQFGPMPAIVMEPTRLQQIFQNLLSNAIKFMDNPNGSIKVECAEEDKFWKFSVADNGPGIDERYHTKIFQLFQTLSPRDELETAGVGLSVVKKAVEASGGKIWVESAPGQGATFLFTIPKTFC